MKTPWLGWAIGACYLYVFVAVIGLAVRNPGITFEKIMCNLSAAVFWGETVKTYEKEGP